LKLGNSVESQSTDVIIRHRHRHRHQPDIWGLSKGMLQRLIFSSTQTIPFLVQQNVGLVPDTHNISMVWCYVRLVIVKTGLLKMAGTL